MSQNKTVIQGLVESSGNNSGAPVGAGQNFYSRSSQPAKHGTVVPGMMGGQNQPSTQSEPVSAPQQKRTVQSGKPIVGFLYSISKTPLGEFWPLQMGRNTIGQSADSDIILPEGTVSTNHAVIVTRQGKNGIIAAIKDGESTNGTLLNGEPLDFESEECHDGDIITIGNNYQLLFVLIDAAKLGLTTSQDFIPVDVEEAEDPNDDVPSFTPGATKPGGFNPYSGSPASWGTSNYQNNGGTIGMDGSVSGGNHGGTISM